MARFELDASVPPSTLVGNVEKLLLVNAELPEGEVA